MEAGNRCFDFRVPEEINRRIVDHISDVNMTYSSIAREYLLREGLPPDQIIKTGSPMYEVLNYYLPKINKSDILNRLDATPAKYFVVSYHREENVDSKKRLESLVDTLSKISELHNLPIYVSTHPRTRNKINDLNLSFHGKVSLLKPLGFCDYVYLQMNAKAVLSDSGTINEESSILNFPALNLRDSHERPEGMEEAAVMMVGVKSERVLQALNVLVDQQKNVSKRGFRLVSDYSMPNVSQKVVRIIHSYTDYVNRNVWKNY